MVSLLVMVFVAQGAQGVGCFRPWAGRESCLCHIGVLMVTACPFVRNGGGDGKGVGLGSQGLAPG